MNLNSELWLPFLIGLFPSLVTIVPTIITIVKNIKINHHISEMGMIIENLNVSSYDVREDAKQLFTHMQGAFSDVSKELSKVATLAKTGITEDVKNITHDLISKTKEAEALFNQMTKETKSYLESMKKQIIDQLEKEINQIVYNVLEIQKERQDQISNK